MGIPHYVLMDPSLFVIFRGIGPENVHNQFLYRSLHFVNDFQRSLYLINLFNFFIRRSDSSMNTQNLLVNQRSQRHVLEHAVYRVED